MAFLVDQVLEQQQKQFIDIVPGIIQVKLLNLPGNKCSSEYYSVVFVPCLINIIWNLKGIVQCLMTEILLLKLLLRNGTLL